MTPVFICAVPWLVERADNARRLAESIPGSKIIWDAKHSIRDTFFTAIRAAGPDPAIFLEDDIALTGNWRTKIENIIAAHPTDVVQCYSDRRADAETGSRYEPGRTFKMTQCFYLPAGLGLRLVAYGESWRWDKDPNGTDTCTAEFLRDEGLRYWLHVPSLVQHETWKSAISDRRPRNRQSRTFQA